MSPTAYSDFLTARRRILLVALADHIRRTGYAPTLRALGKLAGIPSVSTVNWHIRRLSDAGYLVTPTDPHGAMLAHTMSLTERGARAADDAQSVALWRKLQSADSKPSLPQPH